MLFIHFHWESLTKFQLSLAPCQKYGALSENCNNDGQIASINYDKKQLQNQDDRKYKQKNEFYK